MTFNYHLPPDRIAQRPVRPYDCAKLLVVDRQNQTLSQHVFSELPHLLRPSDLLVLNQSGVIAARLFGRLDSGREIEILLLSSLAETRWRALARPARMLQPGMVAYFGQNLSARVVANNAAAGIELEFIGIESENEIFSCGTMPIPPYIRAGHSDQEDLTDYQTIFARESGSVAAPTASLHFTPRLLEELERKGVPLAFITLHLGAASFLPKERFETNGPPASERFNCSSETVRRVRAAAGGVIAVGTSVVRALESSACEIAEETSLFIRPGHSFQMINGLITNFHQPGTTHLELVEALIGGEMLARAYAYALEHDFRFLSYGDAMFVRPAGPV